MNAPKPTTWTVTESSTPAPIRMFGLVADDGTEAYYRIQRETTGRIVVTVRFQEPTSTAVAKIYARAHAARFLAQTLDTIADFMIGDDEPLDIDAEPTMIGCTVELAGAGAVLATAAFFGENAADELFNAGA